MDKITLYNILYCHDSDTMVESVKSYKDTENLIHYIPYSVTINTSQTHKKLELYNFIHTFRPVVFCLLGLET